LEPENEGGGGGEKGVFRGGGGGGEGGSLDKGPILSLKYEIIGHNFNFNGVEKSTQC